MSTLAVFPRILARFFARVVLPEHVVPLIPITKVDGFMFLLCVEKKVVFGSPILPFHSDCLCGMRRHLDKHLFD